MTQNKQPIGGYAPGDKEDGQWKFKAHLGIAKGKGKSIRMEIKAYKTETMYRESGPGQPIYYISSHPENFDSEEKLKEFIDKNIRN